MGVRALCAAVAAVAAAGCAGLMRPDIEQGEIETSVFLIGDAGEPDPRQGSAVLDSLRAQAALAPARSIVVFLGDNVYPGGIPDSTGATYADAMRRLDEEVTAVPEGAAGIFVPGNHDWANEMADGLYAVRREGRMIRVRAHDRDVRMLPPNGCPGPATVDTGRLHLVILDTQWWLHPFIVKDEATDCARTMTEVTTELRAAVNDRPEGSVTVLLSHHPPMTGGEHGGYCGWGAPAHRFAGHEQDILSSQNERMRDSLETAIEDARPLVWAAGHDHSLQVLRGRSTRYILVSGAGSYGKLTCAVRMRESYYVAQQRAGFMRLDVIRGSGVLLRVFTYDFAGNGGLAYSKWLEDR